MSYEAEYFALTIHVLVTGGALLFFASWLIRRKLFNWMSTGFWSWRHLHCIIGSILLLAWCKGICIIITIA
jgi:hypothetical protein